MRLLVKSVVAVFAVIGVFATIQELRGQGVSPLEGATVAHIGIMVTDMDKVSKAFQDTFGVPVPSAREVGPLPLIAGTPDADKSRVKFAQVAFGNTVIEFIQPVAGPGPHREHIDKFGQGLQHLALTVKDPKAAIAHLTSRGGKQTMSNYVDLKDVVGFTVEVLGPPR